MGWKRPQQVFKAWKILRGDQVMIIAGKDKGQSGTITKVLRKENKVIVEGRNLVKKHIKGQENRPGGIVTVEAPLHLSNVQLVDPVTGAPSRVALRYTEEGEKVRVTRGQTSSGSIIPRPAVLMERRKPRPTEDGPKDTLPSDLTVNTLGASRGLPELLNWIPPVEKLSMVEDTEGRPESREDEEVGTSPLESGKAAEGPGVPGESGPRKRGSSFLRRGGGVVGLDELKYEELLVVKGTHRVEGEEEVAEEKRVAEAN